MIAFACTSCGSSFQIGDEYAGRTTKCSKCGNALTVPGFAPVLPSSVVNAPPPAAQSWELPARRNALAGLLRLPNAGLALPLLALGIALLALLISLFRGDSLGSGLSGYDFTTPKAAHISQTKMRLNMDIRALMELEKRTRGKQLQEEIDTLDVRKEVEFQGKKVLFLSFKENGVTKYKTEAYEKHADSGFWVSRYLGTYAVEKDNKELAEQMRRWEESGELSSR